MAGIQKEESVRHHMLWLGFKQMSQPDITCYDWDSNTRVSQTSHTWSGWDSNTRVSQKSHIMVGIQTEESVRQTITTVIVIIATEIIVDCHGNHYNCYCFIIAAIVLTVVVLAIIIMSLIRVLGKIQCCPGS